jgi:hypothetical protein
MIKDLEFIEVGPNRYVAQYKATGEKFDLARKIVADFHDGKIKKK